MRPRNPTPLPYRCVGACLHAPQRTSARPNPSWVQKTLLRRISAPHSPVTKFITFHRSGKRAKSIHSMWIPTNSYSIELMPFSLGTPRIYASSRSPTICRSASRTLGKCSRRYQRASPSRVPFRNACRDDTRSGDFRTNSARLLVHSRFSTLGAQFTTTTRR
jgi:hypothetical protein